MPISLDKIQAQRKILIQDQFRYILTHYCSKAETACKKLQHNLQILIDSLPPALLDQNIGQLLKSHNNDLNAPIYQQQMKLINENNLKTQTNIPLQNYDKKIDKIQEKEPQKLWDSRLEKSPPKQDNKKRVIKNIKKKWIN